MRVAATIIVERPIEAVWQFATAWENSARWQEGVEQSTQTSPGPVGVGTTYRHRSRFMGRAVIVDGVITEYDPPRALAYQNSGTFSYGGRQTFETTDAGTQATYTFEGRMPGALRLIEPFAKWVAQRRIDRDYQRLKTILESQPQP